MGWETAAVKGAGIRFSFYAWCKITVEFIVDNIIAKTDEIDLFRGQFGAQLEHVTVKIWHSSNKFARFKEEIAILSHSRVTKCPNIVKLMGYCCEGNHVGTVYKLQSADTLENVFNKDEFQWRDRMIVALGLARIFHFFGVQGISHRIHATLPGYIILDQETNPVLCDVRMLNSRSVLLDEGGEALSLRNDACFSGDDMTVGKMRPDGIFALGMLLLRLLSVECHVLEDVKTKLPYIVYPSLLRTSQLEDQSFFYQCDCYTVTRLAYQCLKFDEKCPRISEVVQKLENLLLFSLPVRTSSSRVEVGGHRFVCFTYSELCRFKDNFSKENLFAITQFGEAYRGRIQKDCKDIGGEDIIVKMWGKVNYGTWIRRVKNISLEDNICRLKEEIRLLTQKWMIDNPNVVKLLGYCFEDKKVGAVYSVQPLYTLESIFDDEWFEWKDRIVAALEMARTLVLLHRKEQQYVVGNISAAHIMIDKDKKPIVYDFSMIHRPALSGQNADRIMPLVGSIDYVDPYFIYARLVIPQSDIYAFGVLLMSLICKQDMSIVIKGFLYRHVEAEYKSKSSLAHESFASHAFFDDRDGRKLTKLAFACLNLDDVLSRPTASDIVKQLESLSLFSDTLVSTDVEVKAIGSHSNLERTPSWWKHLRSFEKLSANDKSNWRKIFLRKDRRSMKVSSHEFDEQAEIKVTGVGRLVIYEKNPEEIQSRMQEINASLAQKTEEDENRRKWLLHLVKPQQCKYFKQCELVV